MDVLRLAVVAAVATAGPAAAHVSVQPATATAGAYQVLRFGVGHGCDGAATTALRIYVPFSVETARPQPKPGWKLDVQRRGDQIVSISWSGRLAADQFDEFLILAKLPSDFRELAFPALQTCGSAHIQWMGAAPERPAPTLRLTPAAPQQDNPHDRH